MISPRLCTLCNERPAASDTADLCGLCGRAYNAGMRDTASMAALTCAQRPTVKNRRLEWLIAYGVERICDAIATEAARGTERFEGSRPEIELVRAAHESLKFLDEGDIDDGLVEREATMRWMRLKEVDLDSDAAKMVSDFIDGISRGEHRKGDESWLWKAADRPRRQ